MNSTSQLEFHPDAESLNAYAEKALPERERGQIVAHLAECSRCRQVIFLARQADADMEVMAVPTARAAGRSGSWLSGWRLAWIPAVALAGVVGLVFLVHGRHEETGPQMARAVAPTVPQNEASITNPPAHHRVEERKEQSPVSPAAPKLAEMKGESVPMAGASQPVPALGAPPSAAASEAVAVAPPSMTSNASVGQVMEYKPEPIPGTARTQSAGAMYSSNATAAYAPKARMDQMVERDQASRKAGGRYAGSGGTTSEPLKKNAMPHSSYDAGGQMPMVQFEAAPEANAATLPSGLNIVSSVTAENRMLAIDQAGALFLSNDSGSHWESVARQWTGRAVVVSTLAVPSGGAAAAPAAPAEVFELRNDKNLIWVSMDGATWAAQ